MESSKKQVKKIHNIPPISKNSLEELKGPDEERQQNSRSTKSNQDKKPKIDYVHETCTRIYIDKLDCDKFPEELKGEDDENERQWEAMHAIRQDVHKHFDDFHLGNFGQFFQRHQDF